MSLIHPQNPLVASGDVINVPLFESENGLTMLYGAHRIIAMLELGFKVVGTCHGTGKKYQVTLESSKLAYSEINNVCEAGVRPIMPKGGMFKSSFGRHK
ncbi:hypothetical protein D6U78_09575 [Vibrio cholerae]|nr:hypothetical protein [Vibrio cholerae]HDI3249783.1 hypothetical protein [Vibrio cholerae]